MKIKFGALLLVFISVIAVALTYITTPSKVYAATATVDLGNVANFAVMGAAAISDTTVSSTITGDVGLWYNGGASITELKCIEVTGTIYDNDGFYTGNPSGTACLQTNAGTLTTAHSSLTAAYNDAVGRTPNTTYPAIHDLGGATLTPGVYNDPSSFAVTGTLTLRLMVGGTPTQSLSFRQVPHSLWLTAAKLSLPAVPSLVMSFGKWGAQRLLVQQQAQGFNL